MHNMHKALKSKKNVQQEKIEAMKQGIDGLY